MFTKSLFIALVLLLQWSVVYGTPKTPTCVPITETPNPTPTPSSTPYPTCDPFTELVLGTCTPWPIENTPFPTITNTPIPTLPWCDDGTTCTPTARCFEVVPASTPTQTSTPTPTTTPRATCDCRGDYTWGCDAVPTPRYAIHELFIQFPPLDPNRYERLILQETESWHAMSECSPPCGESFDADYIFTRETSGSISGTLQVYKAQFNITFTVSDTSTVRYNPHLSAVPCVKKRVVYWQKKLFFERIRYIYLWNEYMQQFELVDTISEWNETVWTTDPSFQECQRCCDFLEQN